jgi:hypothetical protein
MSDESSFESMLSSAEESETQPKPNASPPPPSSSAAQAEKPASKDNKASFKWDTFATVKDGVRERHATRKTFRSAGSFAIRSRLSSFFEVPEHEASSLFRVLSAPPADDDDDVSSSTTNTDPPPAHAVAPLTGGAKARRFLWLALTALGVIYGDIGTSPLYAFSSSLLAIAPASCQVGAGVACVWPEQEADTIGMLSLLLWSMTLVVTVQYVAVVLSLGFHGEGGTVALASQIGEHRKAPSTRATFARRCSSRACFSAFCATTAAARARIRASRSSSPSRACASTPRARSTTAPSAGSSGCSRTCRSTRPTFSSCRLTRRWRSARRCRFETRY